MYFDKELVMIPNCFCNIRFFHYLPDKSCGNSVLVSTIRKADILTGSDIKLILRILTDISEKYFLVRLVDGKSSNRQANEA